MAKYKIRETVEELEESDGGAVFGGGGGGTAFGDGNGSATYDAPGFGKAKNSIVKKKPYTIATQDVKNQGVIEKYVKQEGISKQREKHIKENIIRPIVEKHLGKYF